MKQMKHWQDPVNAVMGVWLILTPWLLGFQGNMTACVNAVAVGALLVAAALGAIFIPRAWEEWTEVVLGVWLAISPWVLGLTALQTVTGSAFATGLAVAGMALWVLATDKDYTHWLSDRVLH